MQHVFVTGAAGFIGSNLVDRLLSDGATVTGWDNLSTGQLRFLDGARENPRFKLTRGDTLDLPALTAAMQGADFVFHLAANADIRDGWKHPEKDLQQNTIATFNVLEAMRTNGVRGIAFSSTGSVYGEALVTPDKPTPEEDAFPIQTSLYGASKSAGEALLSAYAEGGQIAEAYIFRFVSILGERYTHGHVLDFYRALREDPSRLMVLGDGRQEKSYLYVQDCIDGMLAGLAAVPEGEVGVFNLGTDETLRVDDSVAIITAQLGLHPAIEHTGGTRGWPGDSPFILLDCSRIRSHGWRPRYSIRDSILRTLAWFDENPSVLERSKP